MKSPMEIKITDEFASAMQQLSAEAEKTLPANASANNQSGAQFAQILVEFRMLNNRVTSFEQTVLGRLERLEKSEQNDFAEQFRKMDENMAALRSTETVNQRLFDSLHEEMIKYRDNFLHESLQKPFIRDLVILFDDLSGMLSQLQTAVDSSDGKRNALKQWRDNLENAIHSLTEILHRMEVSEIEPREVVDRSLHKVLSFEPADFAEEDGQIVMRVKRGFLWRDQVLRPEEVVAKRFG
ncbi:MAG TPA: nucleotide exchange factor GrpE [Chthoniobacterales bacterium]|jgi:molecular chaperone GrpE (heat shock protein)|nr:nucleotide exchange factor GrpE [Chthoniobacterales bacterium]